MQLYDVSAMENSESGQGNKEEQFSSWELFCWGLLDPPRAET